MITGIDHLVIAVKDLEAATRAYGELGFTVVPVGGTRWGPTTRSSPSPTARTSS